MFDHIVKSTLLCIVWQAMILQRCGFAKGSNGKACFENQELRLFCDTKEYEYAKKSCEDKDSYLVKIDNADMTEVINTLIDKVNCSSKEDIFIGATSTRKVSSRIWKWLDGSNVYLPNEEGYYNWQPGQPNDVGEREDCLMIDKTTKQWKDAPCSGESKSYICQKGIPIKVKVKHIPNEEQCVGSAGSCVIPVMWRRKKAVVSRQNCLPVYQTIFNGLATLYYEHATIGDAGEYICDPWVDSDRKNQSFTAINIFISGAPEIVGVLMCNTSLHVSWKPHFRSLEFRHRIVATPTVTGAQIKIIEITPNRTVLHFSEVTGLEPSTEYNVKVVACKKMDDCLDDYSAMATATTLEATLRVSNATIHQDLNTSYTCIVTWQWISNIADTFQIITYSSSKETPNATAKEYTIFTENNFYSFLPIPELVYDVRVQPVTNEKYCSEPVKAVGLCVGKKFHESFNIHQTNVAMIIISATAALILLLVVSTVAIFICKKTIKSTQQTTTMELQDVHEYANVKRAEINDTEYIHLQ